MANHQLAIHGREQRRKMIDFINLFQKQNGYSPTMRQVGTSVGIGTLNGVRIHLKRLRDEGVIDYIDGAPRTIRVLRQPRYDERI